MAVPNTSTFSLQDVANEFGLGGGDGLQECFDDSDDSEFDSSYNPNSDGTDNNLLNFRNYGGTLPVNSYVIRKGLTSSAACAGTSFIILYQRSTLFNFNDPIYSNAAGTTNAISQWHSNSILTRFWNGSAWTATAISC